MIYIGIAAYSRTPPLKAIEIFKKFIDRFSSLCRDRVDEVVFVVGGYEGFMRIVVDELIARGFKVVILPPVEQEDKVFPRGAIVIKTGSTFTVRSSILVHTSDLLITFGGGIGSLEEVITAYNEGKDVYVFIGSGLPTDLVASLPRRLDNRSTKGIKVFEEPEEGAYEICNTISAT